MARPRAFEESEVLQCAMLTFWRLGYDATTMKTLEAETGVGVRSLANTFGEKDALFLKSLEAYSEMARGLLEQVFAQPGRAAVLMLFEASVAPKPDDDVTNSGCLMVNSVFELSGMSPEIEACIEGYRSMFRDYFRAALEADGIADAETRAEFLLGALWGILSQIRLARDTKAGAPMAQVVIETVKGW